jgi:hypothetical protein
LKSNQEQASQIHIPFHHFWNIFDREPDNIKSELTCFWAIANKLRATTGTLQFSHYQIDSGNLANAANLFGGIGSFNSNQITCQPNFLK